MLLMWKEFNFSHPKKDRFDKLLNTYFETFKNLKNRIEIQPEKEEAKPLKEALEKAAKEFESWWAVALEGDKYEKNDPEKADIIYQEGLKRFPDSKELLSHYALFLYNIRKDYDNTEVYYKKALEIDPKYTNTLGNYALFLYNIRKDYDKAEEYYKKALEIDPKDATTLGNYTGFLLSRGNENGFPILEKALKFAREKSLTDTLLECLFYQYAHSKDKKLQKKSLEEIKILLNEKIRSPGWNLSDNVERGINDGHSNPDFLEKLSKVISDEIDIRELDGFKFWHK